MPELPEVEVCCRDISPFLVGNILSHTVIRNAKLRWPISKEIYNLNNQIILNVERRAKYLLIKLFSGWIIIHLGMSGRLNIIDNNTLITKHDHWDFVIKNGKILRYHDPRRFGVCLWCKDLNDNKLLSYKGLEPLNDDFNADYLYKKFYKNKTMIKSLIMNNQIVVGIGNIYANESLFKAGILPYKSAMNLNKKEIISLVQSIKFILLMSIDLGGTTIRDFLRVDNTIGNFLMKLQVYGRYNKPCFICQNLIKKHKYNSRSTYWCEFCQN